MTTTRAKQITGYVLDTYRGRTSYYGNPSFSVLIRLTEIEGIPVEESQTIPVTVTLKTEPNAGIAYGITNAEYREAPHVFTLNGKGNIISARKVGA